MSPCGSYLGQYTQQLLNTAISDAKGTYTEVSALSSRVKWAQTVVAVVCLVLGCVMAWSVLRLLGPVQQMIGASPGDHCRRVRYPRCAGAPGTQ